MAFKSRALKSRKSKTTTFRRGKRTATLKAPMYRAVKSIVKRTQPAKQIRFLQQSTSLNTNAAIAAGNNFLIENLSNIAQGDQLNQRERDSVMIKSISIKMIASQDFNANTKARGLRVVIVRPYSHQNVFDSATLSNIFEDETYGNQPYDKLIDSLVFPINRDNLVCYYDKTFRLIPENLTLAGLSRRIFIKLNVPIRYNDVGGPAALPANGPLYLIAMIAEYDASTTLVNTCLSVLSTVYFRDQYSGRIRRRY